MLPPISQIKGIHPGVILEREFRKRGIRKSVFALEMGEYPGVITDVTKMRRGMNAALSLKIEKKLGIEEGYFMVLQAYYEVAQAKKKEFINQPGPEISKIRRGIFWDVNIDNIDFIERERFVIERVFERGNDSEIREIIKFYGKKKCRSIIKSAKNPIFTTIKNAQHYLDLKKEDLKCLKHFTGKQPLKYFRRS
jgi:plasmid maintenance system antidote protein VapI